MLKKIIHHPYWGDKLADWAAGYIRYTRKTCSYITDPENVDSLFRKQQPFILSVWHGQFLLIPTIRPDDIRGTIVVGRHGDAELAAKVVTRFDVRAIRGSGAGGRRSLRDRGGAKVLREAIKALKAGECVVSTADVPPGPAQKVGIGIITMARLSGRPIIPSAITTKRTITLKSWSRVTFNLPFSKCAFVTGDPIHIPRDCTDEEAEQYRLQLEKAMRKVTLRAHELVGSTTRKIDPLWERPLKPGLGLMSYRLLTSYAKPFAPYIFKHRLNRGKEIAAREQERYGISDLTRPDGTLWWIHAASVGETNACLPLIHDLLARNKELNILLTTGTITSAKLAAAQLPERATHQFIPLDNIEFVNNFMRHWRPNLVAFVESEIWPNLILAVKARGIPLLLINGRMSKRSFKRWFKKPGMARPLFGRFNKILAQSTVDARHFISLGAENVIHSGNLKIDAPALSYGKSDYEELKQAIGDRPILIAASTHNGEERIIAQAHKIISLDYPDFLTIIVPRHPDRRDLITKTIEAEGLTSQLRSKTNTPDRKTNIYIADTMGEMGLFYALSKIAFIGGSLIPHGGQNPIEAIRLDTNVMTGTHVGNFADSYTELYRHGGAIKVIDAKDIAAKTIDLLQNPAQHEGLKQGAKAALTYLSGAMAITLQTMENYLPNQNKKG